MERVYMLHNSSLVTTAAPVSQPTGTAIRTMLQIEAPAAAEMTLIEWGISFDGSAASTPGKVELFATTVGATMSTAHVAADCQKVSHNDSASGFVVGGTTHSGFATAAVTEGTVANARMFDMQLLPPTAPYVKQWPLGREPVVFATQFLRVRVTFGTSVNAFIYVQWAE